MVSLLGSSLKTAFLQLPKFSIQSSYNLHQIASRITAMPSHPVKQIPASAPVIPCGSLSPLATIGCGWFTQSVRHKIRNYYPKPRENKRHHYTWYNRMKTKGGRMVLMRRLIKGQICIAHPL